MKKTMERNRTVESFNSFLRNKTFIFDALYTIEITATSGRAHSSDCGFVSIFTGVVKLASICVRLSIFFSYELGSSIVGHVACVNNT